jgi:hypothetical protein
MKPVDGAANDIISYHKIPENILASKEENGNENVTKIKSIRIHPSLMISSKINDTSAKI